MTKRAGARKEFWDFIARADFSMMPQPLKDAFLRVNPDPRALRTMHDKDLARMQSFTDVPDDLVRSVRASTLILAGDRDVPTPEHALELSHLIANARVLIAPAGHEVLGDAGLTAMESRTPEAVAHLIVEFPRRGVTRS
jgi:pimeloyl-ACP methyl ester carboxylesterase